MDSVSDAGTDGIVNVTSGLGAFLLVNIKHELETFNAGDVEFGKIHNAEVEGSSHPLNCQGQDRSPNLSRPVY